MQILDAAFPGAKGARAIEKQVEVWTFTIALFKKPFEWTDRVRAEVYVCEEEVPKLSLNIGGARKDMQLARPSLSGREEEVWDE